MYTYYKYRKFGEVSQYIKIRTFKSVFLVSYLFEVVRVGVYIKIKCMECGHMVMLPRVELNKKIKRVMEEDKND